MKRSQVTILLLDDEESDCHLFEFVLREARLNVLLRVVTDGNGGIEYLTGKGIYRDRREYPHPDVIVLDLRMRQVSGVEFLKWCRTAASCQRIPVVVLTGAMESDPMISAAILAGANRVHLKPGHIQRLQEIIREVFDLGSHHRKGSANPQVARKAA
jgi:CheY-like chemotaxis protein